MTKTMIQTDDENGIFAKDELELMKVDPDWSTERLLDKKAIFYLKDVCKKLRISSIQLKQKAQRLMESGVSPWEEMGIQQIWTHWMVRMTVFAPYLRRNMQEVRSVDPKWDGNVLLGQKGIFYLVDVCKYIPFTANQIRYHAHRNPDSRAKYGVWKDEYLNAFLVDMQPFSRWIKDLWHNGFQ